MTDRSRAALISLRQIQRKTEQASRRLASLSGLTPSQLRVMQILDEHGETTAGEVARISHLKHATITSLVDKLVERNLLERRRCDRDRRRVFLKLLPEGKSLFGQAPHLLQEKFCARFEALPDWHQAMLVAALENIATLLDAENIEAAPILDIGALDEGP